MSDHAKPTPSFWRNLADWLHNAKDKVEPKFVEAVHEAHALAEDVTLLHAQIEALAAHLGPEAVAAVKAVEKAAPVVVEVADDAEKATGA